MIETTLSAQRQIPGHFREGLKQEKRRDHGRWGGSRLRRDDGEDPVAGGIGSQREKDKEAGEGRPTIMARILIREGLGAREGKGSQKRRRIPPQER